jgi:alpha/beta superfamily hydrolase
MTSRTLLLGLFLITCWCVAFGQKERIVTINNAQGKLEGTLTIPKKVKQPPVAIFIAGSGPTDRDGNNPFAKNNSLKYLSDALVKNCIATLRYDKQGVGASAGATKPEKDLVFEDFVDDLILWIDWIKQEYDFGEITLIGHSEGSLIALLAAQKREVKQVVSLAGAGRPIDVVLEEQLTAQDMKLGMEARSIMEHLKRGEAVPEISRDLKTLFRESVRPFLVSWMALNPAEIAGELNVPIVVIQGDKDIQVSVEDAVKLHEGAKAGSYHLIPGMNHILKFIAGDITENRLSYMNGSLPIMFEVVDIITAKIKSE